MTDAGERCSWSAAEKFTLSPRRCCRRHFLRWRSRIFHAVPRRRVPRVRERARERVHVRPHVVKIIDDARDMRATYKKKKQIPEARGH